MTLKKKKSNAGRPKGITDKPRTAPMSFRVSVAHKAAFIAKVPKKDRRAWMERLIDGL